MQVNKTGLMESWEHFKSTFDGKLLRGCILGRSFLEKINVKLCALVERFKHTEIS